MDNKRISLSFVVFFCLATIQFYRPVAIPANLLYYIYYATFFGLVLLVLFFYKSSYNNKFTGPLFLLLFALFLSCFSAAFSWNQGFLDSLKPVSFTMSYILFFLLLIFKLRIKDIEKIILVLGIFYIIIYFSAHILYPKEIFHVMDYGSQRGFQRISVSGMSLLFILSFFSLNKYIDEHKFWWLILYFITLICIILTLTRTIIATSFILSALYILRKSSYLKKILVVIIIGVFVLLVSQLTVFKLMSQESQKQSENWSNYVRVRAADYFLFHFPPNAFAKVMGNGKPYKNNAYSNHVYHINMVYGYYVSDLGYIGIYVTYGIFSIIAFFTIFYRMARTQVPEKYMYAKYFLYFVFLTNIIVPSLISPDMILCIVFALYILTLKETDGVNNPEKIV